MNLHQLTLQYLNLASYLEQGELTPEIENELQLNENTLKEKAINLAYLIKNLESDVDAIEKELERLEGLKKAKNNAKERIKQLISNAMTIYQYEKINSPTLNLSFRKSESIEIINESQISEDFITTKTTSSINKTKIKEAIKQGQQVDGAILQTNFNLQIK